MDSQAITVELRLPFGDAPTFRVHGSARDESIPAMIRALGGLYEPEVMRVLRSIVPPEGIVLDVGANLGAIALPLGWMAPRGTVYAFEPAPANFAYLERNIAANGARNVVAVNAGVHSSAAVLEFHYIAQFAGGAFLSPAGFVDGREERVQVACVTIDAFVASRGLTRVDAIKVDVEGAEEEVLAGAQVTLERLRPRLVIELNPSTARTFFGRTLEGLYARLRGSHYDVAFIERPTGTLHPTTSYAELMAHVERQGGAGDALCVPGR